jgi:hypothetical protein
MTAQVIDLGEARRIREQTKLADAAAAAAKNTIAGGYGSRFVCVTSQGFVIMRAR